MYILILLIISGIYLLLLYCNKISWTIKQLQNNLKYEENKIKLELERNYNYLLNVLGNNNDITLIEVNFTVKNNYSIAYINSIIKNQTSVIDSIFQGNKEVDRLKSMRKAINKYNAYAVELNKIFDTPVGSIIKYKNHIETIEFIEDMKINTK